MEPHRSLSNSIVKRYSGENTGRVIFWEDNTMSKLYTHEKLKNKLHKITIQMVTEWKKIEVVSSIFIYTP